MNPKKKKTYQPLATVVREQPRPTRPPTEPVEIPKRERAPEATGVVGNWPDEPIIIRFHHSTTLYSDPEKIKPTALKSTAVASATTDDRKRVPRERREDGRPRWLSSHKSGKSESRDDFELHICFVCNT